MHVTPRTLVLACIALGLYVGWSAIRSSWQEVAVLRTFDVQGQDLFTTLWVIDDARLAWIQAARPDRRWLSHLRQNPDVELRRDGRSSRYRAMVFDNAEARDHVAPRFREKYGLADRWREWHLGRDTIPVRLESR